MTRVAALRGALLAGLLASAGLACGGPDEADVLDDGRHGAADTAGDGEAGSGLTRDAYTEAYADALCSWATGCGLLSVFGGTPAACLDSVRAQLEGALGGPECRFDPAAAQLCLDGLSLSTCDAPHEDPACAEVCAGGGR